MKSALGQVTNIPNLELQLVGKSISQPDPLTSPIPFLFQYDYLGDRRPVPAGLFPYNYPPSPTVHDKMVRPLLPLHFPSGPLLPGRGQTRADAGMLCAQCLARLVFSSLWIPPPSGLDSNTNMESGVSYPSSSVTQGRGAGTRSGSVKCPPFSLSQNNSSPACRGAWTGGLGYGLGRKVKLELPKQA